MQSHRGHRGAMRCESSLGIECAECCEHGACLTDGPSRRQIEPAQRGGIADASGRELKRKRREIRLENLRCAMREELCVIGAVPAPVADAGRYTPRASSPLVGGVARDTYCLESRHSRAR